MGILHTSICASLNEIALANTRELFQLSRTVRQGGQVDAKIGGTAHVDVDSHGIRGEAAAARGKRHYGCRRVDRSRGGLTGCQVRGTTGVM